MAQHNILTTSRLVHPINLFFVDTFLPYVLGKMPHAQFGKKVKMPARSGVKIKWGRLSVPTAQTTPMQEDVDPTPIVPTRTDLEATVVEYGAQVHRSEWLDLTEVTGENAAIMEWLMDTYALTMDELVKQMLATTASTLTFSSGAVTGTDLNATDLDTAVQTLMNQDAERITPMMGASTKVGTTPVMPSYVGIINVALWSTLKGLAGFREVKNYASQGDIYEGELGQTDGIRWIGTTRGYVSSGTYRLPILGKNAYGMVKIPGGEKVLGHKTAEQASSDMDRYSVAYYKTNFVCRILDDLNMLTAICTKP